MYSAVESEGTLDLLSLMLWTVPSSAKLEVLIVSYPVLVLRIMYCCSDEVSAVGTLPTMSMML